MTMTMMKLMIKMMSKGQNPLHQFLRSFPLANS